MTETTARVAPFTAANLKTDGRGGQETQLEVVPRIIVLAIVINGLMGFAILLASALLPDRSRYRLVHSHWVPIYGHISRSNKLGRRGCSIIVLDCYPLHLGFYRHSCCDFSPPVGIRSRSRRPRMASSFEGDLASSTLELTDDADTRAEHEG